MTTDEQKNLKSIYRDLAKLVKQYPALREIVTENESLISLHEQIRKNIERLNNLDQEDWIKDNASIEQERRRFAPELTPDEARRQFHTKLFFRVMEGRYGRVIEDELILLLGVMLYIYEKKFQQLEKELKRDISDFNRRREELIEKSAGFAGEKRPWGQKLDELVALRDKYERFEELGVSTKLKSIESLLGKIYYSVCSSYTYYKVRRALGLGRFELEANESGPTFRFEGEHTQGLAQIHPLLNRTDLNEKDRNALVEQLAKEMLGFSDLDADVLDILYLFWQHQAQKEEDVAFASVDDILRIRGMIPKLGGQGRRGGFGPQQRDEVLKAIYRLEHVHIEVRQPVRRGWDKSPEVEDMKSPLLTIFDFEFEQESGSSQRVKFIGYKPGEVILPYLLGPGRQVSLLAARALNYNLRTEVLHKRLARYLSWIWRIRSTRNDYGRPFKVGTVLEAIRLGIDKRNPHRTYERFEAILDKLVDDKVIKKWIHKSWDENLIGKRGWTEKWLKANFVNRAAPGN